MGAFRRRWPGVSYGRGEGWHYVGEAGEPAFENSWANVSGGVALAFRIRESGVVDIHGGADSGTPGSTIFTLPTGYRPSSATSVATLWAPTNLTPVTASQYQFLDVATSGAVSTPNAIIFGVAGQFFLDPPVAAP